MNRVLIVHRSGYPIAAISLPDPMPAQPYVILQAYAAQYDLNVHLLNYTVVNVVPCPV